LHIDEKENELIIPDFIMDPQIRAEAMQLLKYAEKYETIDIREVSGIHIFKDFIFRLSCCPYLLTEDQILKRDSGKAWMLMLWLNNVTIKIKLITFYSQSGIEGLRE
jgi:hypothetical protein